MGKKGGHVGRMSGVPRRDAVPSRGAPSAADTSSDPTEPGRNLNDIALRHGSVRLPESRVNVAYRDRDTTVTSALTVSYTHLTLPTTERV